MAYALPAAPVILVDGGTGGGPGPTPADNEFYLRFSFGDSSPALIGEAAAGKAILSARILLEEPLDGTGAALSIGSASSPEDVMEELDVDVTQAAEFSVYPLKTFGTDTNVYLHITPGSGATTGSGVAVLEMEP